MLKYFPFLTVVKVGRNVKRSVTPIPIMRMTCLVITKSPGSLIKYCYLFLSFLIVILRKFILSSVVLQKTYIWVEHSFIMHNNNKVHISDVVQCSQWLILQTERLLNISFIFILKPHVNSMDIWIFEGFSVEVARFYWEVPTGSSLSLTSPSPLILTIFPARRTTLSKY